MEENKMIIKNMEYWKKKNNIPGIEALADSGLTDGRAGSSAFQMATPGSSPNKFMGLAGATAGMLGFGAKKDEEPKELLEGTGKKVEKVTGFKVSGGDEGADVAGGTGVADGAVAEDPDAALTMKSPMKQEEKGPKTIAGQDIIKGEGDDEGNFYYDTGGDDQIYIEDPDGIVAKSVMEDGYVEDLDFLYEETEDGYYKVTGVKGETGGDEMPEEEMPVEQDPMGGVGEIKEM